MIARRSTFRGGRLAAAVAMVAVAVTVLASSPARAQTSPTSPTSPTSQIRLTSQTTWVANNQSFQIGLAVTTPSPGSARVQLTVFSALPTRSDFQASLSNQFDTGPLKVFDVVPLSSLGPSPELSVAVNPVGSRPPQSIFLSASGVYPVGVDLFDARGALLSRMTTHLLYSASDASIRRLDVAWVAPFSAPPPSPPAASGSSGVSASDQARLLSVSRGLAAHPTVPVTLAATPQTIDGMANGSAADKATVTQLAQAVGSGLREVVAAPYVRLDLPSMLGAGLDGEIGAQRATGTGVLAADLHVVPTSDTWIGTGPLSPAAIDDLAGLGTRQIVVTGSSLSPLPSNDLIRTLAQPFLVMGKTSRLSGVAVDPGLVAHFGSTSDELLAAHQLLADLAMIQLELPNSRNARGVVIVPPAGWQPDANFLDTFLAGLGTAPMLAPVTVDQLFSDVPLLAQGKSPLVRSVAPSGQQAPGQSISDGAAIRAARRPVTALAAVVPAGAGVISQIDRRILISESADLPDRSRPAQLATATTLIRGLKALVRLPGNQSITFTARQGLIPITILSSASYPLRVQLRISSQKLAFRSVRLPGSACTESATSAVCALTLSTENTTVRVPVVARTAGVFSLTVSLNSPDGSLTLATNQDTVRSTAASEVGVILSIGAVLLLAVWWVRDVRHGRRARRLVPRDAGGAGAGFGPAGPPRRVPASGGPGRSGVSGGRPPVAVGLEDPLEWATASRVFDDRPGPDDPFWDEPSGRITQPIPIIPVDPPSETPQPSLAALLPVPPRRGQARDLTLEPPLGRPHDRRRSAPPAPVRNRQTSSPRPPARRRDRPVPVPPGSRPGSRGAAASPRATDSSDTSGSPRVGTAAAPDEALRPDSVSHDTFSRNTAVMASGTLLSRLTGFGRVLALIWAFGITTGVTDVYNVANTAPNILYDLVLGGILSATLVPVFVDYLNHDDPEEGRRAISAVVTAITVTLVGLSAVFWLLAPWIIRFYLVLNNTATASNEKALGTALLHMFVPQLFLLGGIAVTTALLNARRRFAAAAYSPVANNVVAIAAIVAARMIASSLTLGGFRHDQSAVLILGLGTTAGYLFQFLVQIPPVMRGGFHLRPVWDLRHPAVRTVLRLSLWTFGSVIANQISFNLILVLAEHRKGDVTVFNTAYQFFQLPYAIFAVSIASVITPDLAEHWAQRDLPGFRRQMANGLKLTLAVLVPAAVGYVVLAQPFLHLVLEHGSLSAGNTRLIASVVVLFAAGLPGFSAYLLLMRGYQAMQDTRAMFWLYLLENLATIVLAAALYPLLGVRGLAVGWVGAYSIGSIVAFAHLRRRTGGLDGGAVMTGALRVVAATGLMILPVLALTHLIAGHSDLVLLAQVGGGVVAGSVVYLAAARAFGISELTSLLRKRRPQ